MQGDVASAHRAARAICYCRDCQSFARFLGKPAEILNDLGGTDVVATAPRFVHFARGRDQLRCMSLSGKGLYRWYAQCCRTPIGNTPRDPRLSYVGLVHNCLAGDLDAVFGPARSAVNTASASGKVDSSPWSTFVATLKIVRNVLGARLGGGYRENPFFKPGTTEPVVAPKVLTLAERQSLRG